MCATDSLCWQQKVTQHCKPTTVKKKAYSFPITPYSADWKREWMAGHGFTKDWSIAKIYISEYLS